MHCPNYGKIIFIVFVVAFCAGICARGADPDISLLPLSNFERQLLKIKCEVSVDKKSNEIKLSFLNPGVGEIVMDTFALRNVKFSAGYVAKKVLEDGMKGEMKAMEGGMAGALSGPLGLNREDFVLLGKYPKINDIIILNPGKSVTIKIELSKVVSLIEERITRFNSKDELKKMGGVVVSDFTLHFRNLFINPEEDRSSRKKNPIEFSTPSIKLNEVPVIGVKYPSKADSPREK